MARKSSVQVPTPSAASNPAAPLTLSKSKIKVKAVTPLEVHYMSQIDFAFSYISGISERNIAVVVLDSYLDEDSLLTFAGKYFQSLFKPGRSSYYGEYFEYNGNKIQFASVTTQPKLENYFLFTVGNSLEYTEDLTNWIKSGKCMNQQNVEDPFIIN